MKHYFLPILLLISSCLSLHKTDNYCNKCNGCSAYKIKKIRKKSGYYIIYAARNDSVYKIISENKTVKTSYTDTIKVGRCYLLDLRVIFPPDTLFGIPVAPNLGITGLAVCDDIVNIDNKTHNKLYCVKGLNGLYMERKHELKQ